MYCTQCGTLAVAGGNYCANCGHPHAAAAPVAVTTSEPVFAGFWLRAGAFAIDQGILVALFYFGLMFTSMMVFGVALGLESTPFDHPFPAFAGLTWLWVLVVAVPWLYHALFESSNKQATPGKLACGIKLTNLAGERVGFGRASARYFASWITNVTFLVGYLTVAFTEKRQSLHDLIARTLVVGAKIEPARVANATPAQQLSGWVVAAIAAGCSIFPLGMLAAIAIPAYQDYTVRTQVTEGLKLAAEYKSRVQAYADEHGAWPASESDLTERKSLDEAIQGSRYIESIEIWNGTIVIAYGPRANPRIRDHLVSLRPFVTGDGGLVWLCGNAMVEDEESIEAKPPGDDATDSDIGVTSVIDRYLPARCRSDYVQAAEGVA